MLSAICRTSSGGAAGSPLGRGNHSLVTLRFKYSAIARFTLKDNETQMLRHAGNMKAGNVEKEPKIRKELAWIRTEQKEVERWIDVALRDLGSLPPS